MLTPAAADKAPRGRPFQRQWEMSCTLWSDQQTEELAAAIRGDLESELGPIREERSEAPPTCAVGWGSEQGYNRLFERDGDDNALSILSTRAFDGLRIRRCLGCGQRTAWRPSFGMCVCGKRCAVRATENDIEARIEAMDARIRARSQERATAKVRTETREPERRFAVLVADPIATGRIADSLRRQLAEQHAIQARFVGSTLVWNIWHVLEFTVTDGNGGNLHVILNGSGPGRARWTLGTTSAEAAVMKTIGHFHAPNTGIPHPQ